MDYTEKALLEGNLSSLMDMRIKEAEDICESLCWRILDVSAFINNSGEKAEIQNAEQDLSDYKTMLVNAQELVDLLREQKKKTNRKDWEEDLDEEFPEADDSLYIEKLKQRMEESSEDDFDYLDLAARLAEFEDECEEREKEYLSLDISEPEPKKKPKTSCLSRFFKNLKSLVLD